MTTPMDRSEINRTHIPANQIKVGDVILPPAREMQLWMVRACRERNLPETALHLTVREVREAMPDKRGSRLLIRCDQTPEWNEGRSSVWPFSFKVRPDTSWPLITTHAA